MGIGVLSKIALASLFEQNILDLDAAMLDLSPTTRAITSQVVSRTRGCELFLFLP